MTHKSGCALHGAPALSPAPCDCGAPDILARIATVIADASMPESFKLLLAECAIVIRCLRDGAMDLTHADTVEVVWDPVSRRLWINTEAGNVGRIYNIDKFDFKQLAPDDPTLLLRRNPDTGKWAWARTAGPWMGGFDSAKDAVAAACVDGDEAIEFVETRE
jgi:hypothetical protein